MKVFSDVQIFVTSYNKNFIDIKIVVEQLPVLKSIEFEGCKKIKESNLIDKIILLTMQRISENDILKAKNIIIQEYESKNYHNIKHIIFDIDITKLSDSTNVRVILTFDCDTATIIHEIYGLVRDGIPDHFNIKEEAMINFYKDKRTVILVEASPVCNPEITVYYE